MAGYLESAAYMLGILSPPAPPEAASSPFSPRAALDFALAELLALAGSSVESAVATLWALAATVLLLRLLTRVQRLQRTLEAGAARATRATREQHRKADLDVSLAELRRTWLEQIRPSFAPGVDDDPYLAPPDLDAMLCRFLDAEHRGGSDPHLVHRAAARLRATAEFRRDYACSQCARNALAISP